MNILLTNDDGYTSSGLIELKKILSKYGTVYMFAPKEHQSGKGCAMSAFVGVNAQKIDDYNYIVDGTPVDCVQLAQCIMDNDIDLVVSGCNNGYNISTDTIYSGTCGACYQALLTKKKAIAISSERYDKPIQLIKEAEKIFDFIFDNNLLSSDYFLNVNLQNPKFDKPKGIKITQLYIRDLSYKLLKEEKGFYYTSRYFEDVKNDDKFDVSAINNGYISITPLSINNCNEIYYEKLKKLVYKK